MGSGLAGVGGWGYDDGDRIMFCGGGRKAVAAYEGDMALRTAASLHLNNPGIALDS